MLRSTSLETFICKQLKTLYKMKNFLLFLFFHLSLFLFSQTENDSLNIRYEQQLTEYKNLNTYDSNIEKIIRCIKDFNQTYSKLLEIQDLKNINLQKALINNFAEKYSDLFIISKEGKKINWLQYGFESKKDISEYIQIGDGFLKYKLILAVSDLIIDKKEKEVAAFENYLIINLKRLGISREDYENLSQKDKDLLWEKFK